MKKATIFSGNFSGTAKGRKNNFSGYTAQGERIFISKQQMEGVDMGTKEELKFPLYCFIQEKTFDIVNDKNEVIEKDGIKRVQATAVFTTVEKMVEAINADATIDLLAKTDLITKATAAGLNAEQANQLAFASI